MKATLYITAALGLTLFGSFAVFMLMGLWIISSQLAGV